MNVIFAVRDVSSKETLSQYFLALTIRLIDVVFLKYVLILLALLLLVGLDDVLIVFVEIVVGLYNFRSHTVVATHSLSDSLVFLGAFLIQDDEN